MGSGRGTPAGFEWVGGNPSLDFVNTASYTTEGEANERLQKPSDLLAWARSAGLMSESETGRSWEAQPESVPATDALQRARAVRAALHNLFVAAADGSRPSPEAVKAFNQVLGEALGHLRLISGSGGWSWSWQDPDDWERPIRRVVWAAAQLLTSPERRLLKHCAASQCGWVFLDRSRNRSRRWCDMRVCGNNDKARRFHQRRRAGRPPL